MSGNTAVQVIFYDKRITKVLKHIGSARNEEGLVALIKIANEYIIANSGIHPLLPDIFGSSSIEPYSNLELVCSYHKYAYEYLSFFYHVNGFDRINNNLIKSLQNV